jgi:hypothetical protein
MHQKSHLEWQVRRFGSMASGVRFDNNVEVGLSNYVPLRRNPKLNGQNPNRSNCQRLSSKDAFLVSFVHQKVKPIKSVTGPNQIR